MAFVEFMQGVLLVGGTKILTENDLINGGYKPLYDQWGKGGDLTTVRTQTTTQATPKRQKRSGSGQDLADKDKDKVSPATDTKVKGRTRTATRTRSRIRFLAGTTFRKYRYSYRTRRHY